MNSLLKKYLETRRYSEKLCNPLKEKDYSLQLIEFTSPPKWHLAHVTWFFEVIILHKFLKNYKFFNLQFNYLFNSYYHSIGKVRNRSERSEKNGHNIEEIYKYRKYVDQYIDLLVSSTVSENTEKLIILGINHEQQHQELLLTDIKYTFAHTPSFPVYKSNFNLMNDKNEDTGWITKKEGVYEVGHNSNQFCFDNELGRHKVYLNQFKISKSLVTNREYLEFIEDGGYKKFNYWLDDGWQWITDQKIQNPLYWYKIKGKWFYYTLSGLKPLIIDAVLSHVSFYEAYAFANWKKLRLATEFEWEIASNDITWGSRWEWTYSSYLPYPSFKILDGSVGEYNGKFMINQMVLRGSSIATPKNHCRNTYRNFFHPHLRWQYTGIRLVKK